MFAVNKAVSVVEADRLMKEHKAGEVVIV